MTLAELGRSFNARAAGFWRVQGQQLVQVEFWGAKDLPATVAQGFAAATKEVPINRVDLGIVGAVVSAAPRVSIRSELPSEAGSAIWLGYFGANRSIAVPWAEAGIVKAVASIAVSDPLELTAVMPQIHAFLSEMMSRVFHEGDGASKSL